MVSWENWKGNHRKTWYTWRAKKKRENRYTRPITETKSNPKIFQGLKRCSILKRIFNMRARSNGKQNARKHTNLRRWRDTEYKDETVQQTPRAKGGHGQRGESRCPRDQSQSRRKVKREKTPDQTNGG